MAGLVGPYHAYNYEPGWFDYATRTLYWIDSITDVGDYWGAYPGVCGGDPSGGGALLHSYTVVINILAPDLTLTQVTTDPLPCSYNAAPSGRLVVTDDNFYICASSGYGKSRWFKVNRDGTCQPCPEHGANFTVMGKLSNVFDDGWGGSDQIYITVASTWTRTIGLVIVDAAGVVWQFENDTPITLPNGAGLGHSIAAAVCIDDSDNAWVLSTKGSGGTGTVPVMTKIDSTFTATNYDLDAGSTAESVSYYQTDQSLLYWVDNTLTKWDIATQADLATASVTFDGSGPIDGGWLPNGLDFYDPVTLAQLPFSADGTGLPDYDKAYIFKHWLDYTGEVLWLQTNKISGTGSIPYVYGVSWYVIPPLTLACASGTGALGTPYMSALVAGGGVPGYTFAIIEGSLPPGLTLNTSTGVISGTPTKAGLYPYTAQVTDSADTTATASCAIVITTNERNTCGKMPTLEVTRDIDADWRDSATFYITQSDPFPFTLRALVYRMEYNQD